MFIPPRPISNPDRRAADRIGIRENVEHRQQGNGHTAVGDDCCDSELGVLCLHGILPAHYLKQVAEAMVAYVEGVRLIINQIEVGAPVAGEKAQSRERHAEADTSSEMPPFDPEG
jgi:hypothetical protein